ncbi:MAG: hypothetical protein R6X25_14995 [Candidatus Krumholzibacteriia bacterium]
MYRRIMIMALAAVMVAGVAQAQEMRAGSFSLGFTSDDAPIGVRYFLSDNTAFDVGIGFESEDLGEENASSFWLEAGFWYVLYDYGDSFFFVRPAVQFASLDDRVFGTGGIDDTWSVIDLELNLGAEVRLARNFGLTFQHGLRFTTTSLPDDAVPGGGEDSFTDFSTFGENVTQAGVWFVF